MTVTLLKAIDSCRISSKLVSSCINSLNALGSFAQVQLRWVKAHAGFPGNEYADTLAHQGALKGGPFPRVPRSDKNIKGLIKQHVLSLWTE